MAHVLGRLGLPASPPEALPLLHRAATLAFTDVGVEKCVFAALIPAGACAEMLWQKPYMLIYRRFQPIP